ncbi:MAG: PilZ domain-containing protein [Methylotenera sp.]|nr:PilZ domain-containing protein [Oligoflexia bacterium]
MKSRPDPFNYLCVFLLCIALSFPLQIMALYGHSPLEYRAILGKIAPLNWIILSLATYTSYLALRASRLLLVSVPLLVIAVTYNNWLVASTGLGYSKMTTGLASVFFLAAMASFARKETLEVILKPQMRWWLTPPRWKVQVPVRMKLFLKNSKEYKVETFDISENGAFLPVSASLISDELPVGSQCFLSLPLPGLFYIQCRGEIVRSTRGNGNYPAGVGVRFLGMNHADRKKLTNFLKAAAEDPKRADLASAA